MLNSQEVIERTESWNPGLHPDTKVNSNLTQPGIVTNNSSRRRHPQSANHSIYHHGTPHIPPILLPGSNLPSPTYRTHPIRNHHHRFYVGTSYRLNFLKKHGMPSDAPHSVNYLNKEHTNRLPGEGYSRRSQLVGGKSGSNHLYHAILSGGLVDNGFSHQRFYIILVWCNVFYRSTPEDYPINHPRP